MDCLVLRNHLLPCAHCVIPAPFLSRSLSFLPPSHLSFSPLYLPHLSIPLSICLPWCIRSPPLSTALCPFYPSFPKKWTVPLCLFIILYPSSHRRHKHARTHTQPLSKSLCHSDFLRLQFSPSPPAFSLSVSSKNSINQRLPALFSPHDYLWSRCSYHFSAPDKCTEYSTQPRREYFITGQMRRGEQQTCAIFLNLASPSLRAIVGLNLHITHHPPQTTTASLLSSSTWSTFFSFTASPCMIWTLLPNSPLHFYTSGFLWCLCLCLVLVPCKKKKKKELIMSLAELTGTLQEF